MSEPILVDSCCYINWLRQRVDFQPILRQWLLESTLFSCGIVRAEVLRGVINPAQKERLEAYFDVIPEVPTDAQIWREATDLAWHLDRKGTVLPLTDIVIALCALRVGATVISPDQHFQAIDGPRWRADLSDLS